MTSVPASPPLDSQRSPWHGYKGLPGCYDEMMSSRGTVREPWHKLIGGLDQLGTAELTRRWEEGRRLIRDNGVTYNVYADPQGIDRPWQLDPLPLVLSSAEWARAEAGLIQRARLLEMILADLYGPMELLKRGLLPPELIFAHPNFLRPCHGLRLPNNRHLHLYAADLGRTIDGKVWVVNDRTQAPSGAGYTLENRLVLSGMLPDVFRDCQVQRLALYFRTMRDNLISLAPRQRENPRVVLLTPGPYNETYFEHAYLARYLGLTLVEGGDLTVRDHRVYLKLLGGLQPIDVILRRLDDNYCDPLELWGGSFLGVPGLVQAVRAGNLAVANPLGSGLVQTPALNVFLPPICKALLGEDLLLQSTPTWWCANPRSRQHVLANLHRLVIKRTYPAPGKPSVFGGKLDNGALQRLAAEIEARPHAFVAQEQLALSTAPVMIENRTPGNSHEEEGTWTLQPRHLVMRALLTASNDSFVVMPGGLTRYSASEDSLVVSLQHGGGSKDTWILSSAPVSRFSMLPPPGHPIPLSRGGGDLPSRAADDLFWLGRYAERAEGMVRLLRAILVRLTEKSGLSEAPELPLLLRALLHPVSGYGAAGEAAEPDPANAPPGYRGNSSLSLWRSGSGPSTLDMELLTLVFDAGRIGSLRDTLASLRRVAACVRDRVSLDTWRILRSLDTQDLRPGLTDTAYQAGNGAPLKRTTGTEVVGFLNQMVIGLAAFCGMALESMTRGHGWRFLDMGRRMERSIQLIRLFRNTLRTVSSTEGPLLEALLEVGDSSMTYRRRYLTGLQAAPVLDLLLADDTNPRSLIFQLTAIDEHLDALPHDQARVTLSPGKRILVSALNSLLLADMETLAQGNQESVREPLDALLANLETQLPLLCDTITRTYLSHAETVRQRTYLDPPMQP